MLSIDNKEVGREVEEGELVRGRDVALCSGRSRDRAWGEGAYSYTGNTVTPPPSNHFHLRPPIHPIDSMSGQRALESSNDKKFFSLFLFLVSFFLLAFYYQAYDLPSPHTLIPNHRRYLLSWRSTRLYAVISPATQPQSDTGWMPEHLILFRLNTVT